jgi:hypothetical protein
MLVASQIYGLGVQVNRPLDGLRGLPEPEQIDVRIEIGPLPDFIPAAFDPCWRNHHASEYGDESGNPAVLLCWSEPDRSYCRLRYLDGTVVVILADGSRVWASAPIDATTEDTATYLLGPILGLVLRLRGVVCLHGSAVAVGNKAIAIVGPSGAGKSSTAAAFARRGYSVLTDDVVALGMQGGELRVYPAYPRIRLWPEAVHSMFGSSDALPRLTPTWEKRFLDTLEPARFQARPLPLAAIYFLADRREAGEAHEVSALDRREALIRLISDTYVNYVLDQGMRAAELKFLGKLIERVPMRQVAPSNDMGRISELCDQIRADFDTLELPPEERCDV